MNKQHIGCYIYFNTDYGHECNNIVVEHHKIGNMTCKGMGKKADDEDTMFLCTNHHTGKYGIHQLGVETWEKKYGSQLDMIKWSKERRGE